MCVPTNNDNIILHTQPALMKALDSFQMYELHAKWG